MRAAILASLREPLVLDDVDPPDELSVGQVRVRVAFSGVCGSQLGEIDGVKGADPWLPHLLGHEGSGTVAAIGPGVRTVAPGDRVVLHWMPGEGIESQPPVYSWRGERLNAGWVTTFNEEAVVAENRVTVLPNGFPLDLAALLGGAVTTGFGVVTNDARLRIGESVVVFGTGGVGLSVVQGAALAGAHPIVAIDLHANRLELALRLGATHAIDATAVDAETELGSLLGDQGADVTVDNTGDPDVIARAYRVAGPHGRTILVGVPRHDVEARLNTLPLHFGKVLTGSHGGSAQPPVDIPRYVAMERAGKLRLRELITDRYPLGRVNDAIADLRSGRSAGRCLIEIDPRLDDGGA
jgi:S-(hydroxymethyl)glutathione dehydrogenase/alcohol dehydrogenase